MICGQLRPFSDGLVRLIIVSHRRSWCPPPLATARRARAQQQRPDSAVCTRGAGRAVWAATLGVATNVTSKAEAAIAVGAAVAAVAGIATVVTVTAVAVRTAIACRCRRQRAVQIVMLRTGDPTTLPTRPLRVAEPINIVFVG
ncbi:hypothetical protein MGAST_17480 [Mycobacterium gastri 'Wayne']|uniref:Uncharacterized protein n=1 Tax=Mycobacterium gastri TaxID=1777 RepID=A0A1X1VI76_MYCGS|nr:hypothetical protein MGAST_17480 [Mycobacterium gastri 'Wayne']ORV68733.1 hypothetical protein AWC07_07510 [Mycobacterium gastri]